jgi:hypothetical protein
MGKHQAASVPWVDLSAAIQANPARAQRLGGSGAAASLAAMPADDTAVPWLTGWSEDAASSIPDIVALVLWLRDPLYRTATQGVRRAMEKEEAAALLHDSERVWRDCNGRARGWVRKHLEEDLRSRAAGGDPAPDAWERMRTTKRAALLVDYVCSSRGLRVGFWWPDQKTTTVIPWVGGSATTVANLNCTAGRILVGPTGVSQVPAATWPELLLRTTELTWAPPACAPGPGNQTVAAIQTSLDALQPGLPRTGGRAGLWNRLLWERFLRSLKGLPDPLETDVPDSSAAPSP